MAQCHLILAFAVTAAVMATAVITASAAAADEPFFSQRPQPWKRLDRPVLSTLSTKQTWCKVTLYSPHVIRVNGSYKMWYLGNSTRTRTIDMAMGLAESRDGIHWTEHDNNPILKMADLPWGSFWQTPFVLYDADLEIYKMWFTSLSETKTNDEGRLIAGIQQLGYAISPDGIRWKIRPKPIFEYGRSPCVMKEAPHRYRLWMNSGPLKDGKRTGLLQNIFEFTSTDGINWKQHTRPAIQPSGLIKSVVYPYVIRHQKRYYMWYGGHVAGGHFELFCAESQDGSNWKIDHQRPAFPATRDKDRFDGRYTSTPCLVPETDRFLLYYSARDLSDDYIDGMGNRRRDGAGVYRHIGVATYPRKTD